MPLWAVFGHPSAVRRVNGPTSNIGAQPLGRADQGKTETYWLRLNVLRMSGGQMFTEGIDICVPPLVLPGFKNDIEICIENDQTHIHED